MASVAPKQPSIIGYPDSFDADVPLKLACICTGSRPAADLGWYLDGARLTDTEVVVVPEIDGTFTVRSFLSQRFSNSENGTRLTCAVTNRVLTQQNVQPLTSNITLIVSRMYYVGDFYILKHYLFVFHWMPCICSSRNLIQDLRR